MLVDHRVAQLLCSRLCHDLSGPAGAVNTGLELIEEGADPGGEARNLVERSAREVISRLNFFRVAFGSAGMASVMTLGQVRDLAVDHLARGLVGVDWPDQETPPPSKPVRPPGAMLILNLLLLGVEVLPRGGTLQFRFAEVGVDLGLALAAKGRGATLKPEQRAAMDPETPIDSLSARTVPGYCVSRLAREHGIAVEVSEADRDEVRIAAILPGG